MDLDENTNVLDEVEILFKKLESLPEHVRRIAFDKIQQKLPSQGFSPIKSGGAVGRKRLGRKRKAQTFELPREDGKETDSFGRKRKAQTFELLREDGKETDSFGRKRKAQTFELPREDGKETDSFWSSENSEADYFLENVLTSRGRKAKRISYAYLHEYGKGQDDFSEKHKKIVTEVKEEKETDPLGDPLSDPLSDPLGDGDLTNSSSQESVKVLSAEPVIENVIPIVKIEEESTNTTETCQEIESNNKDISQVIVTDVSLTNDACFLENMNSEEVDNPVVVSQESQEIVVNASEQEEKSAVIPNVHTNERQLKIKKGFPRCGALVWRKRKMARGGPGLLSCQECTFTTSSKSLLDVHLRRHTGVKPYVCPDCGKAFPQSSGLNVHMKRHRGQRDYACDYCEYRAYTKVDKIRHMTIHTGERNQICQYCGKAFAKDSTLREHVRSIHERPFKHICSECGFTTYRASNLRVHVRMRHRGEYNNHICPVCGAQVKQRNAFLEHMRAHTGEKPYRCDQCGSSFACLARLTVHVKSVHEPRKFPCSECRKTFQTKHHLIRHSVIHTKEKPFICPYCTYSCNTQGNMTKHVKTIHHMPHFSYRKYKADQDAANESSLNPEWVEKGQKVTEEYLKDLSSKLGRDITLEELKTRESEKQKKINEEAEQAKVKRMNRIQTPEHSYHSRVGKASSGNQKYLVKVDKSDVADPTTLILQVAAENADDLVKDEAPSQSHIVEVDLLSGMSNEEVAKSRASQLAPHIMKMLQTMGSENSGESNTQVIHVQTSEQLPASVVEGSGEYETLILSGEGEDTGFVSGQVYELVSGQNLKLCLNTGLFETDDCETIQVLRQDEDVEQNSSQQVINFSETEHLMSVKNVSDESADTVVVIINTDQPSESTL